MAAPNKARVYVLGYCVFSVAVKRPVIESCLDVLTLRAREVKDVIC